MEDPSHPPSNSDQALFLLLGRLEGKLDGLIRVHDSHAEQIESLERRVADLEKAKTWLLGAAAGVGALTSFISKQFFGGAP